MITIILHHAALELINNKICNVHHNAIINDANRRNKPFGEILLDISVHQSAINQEKMSNTGRPDLVHFFLLLYHHIIELLPEEIKKGTRLFVHTKNDEFFLVPNSWRVPVHYIRFRGLMEKFLVEKTVKFSEKEILQLKTGSLISLIHEINPESLIQLVDTGKYDDNLIKNMKENIISNQNIAFLIGGYQKGEIDINKDITVALKEISIVDKPTTAWMILNLLLTGLISKN